MDTNAENILIAVISGIIILVLNTLTRKYIEPIMPDRKKAISLTKKYLVLYLKYGLPFMVISWAYFEMEFNKFFIIVICFNFSVIVFNIATDYFNILAELLVKYYKLK